VATLIALRERGLPRPAAGVCISPGSTSRAAAPATRPRPPPTDRDPYGVAELARAYLGTGDPKTPLASPLYADLQQLPPAARPGRERRGAARRRARPRRAGRAAGVDVTVEEWPAMIHVWHWFLPLLDEAERAIAVVGDFVRARIG